MRRMTFQRPFHPSALVLLAAAIQLSACDINAQLKDYALDEINADISVSTTSGGYFPNVFPEENPVFDVFGDLETTGVQACFRPKGHSHTWLELDGEGQEFLRFAWNDGEEAVDYTLGLTTYSKLSTSQCYYLELDPSSLRPGSELSVIYHRADGTEAVSTLRWPGVPENLTVAMDDARPGCDASYWTPTKDMRLTWTLPEGAAPDAAGVSLTEAWHGLTLDWTSSPRDIPWFYQEEREGAATSWSVPLADIQSVISKGVRDEYLARATAIARGTLSPLFHGGTMTATTRALALFDAVPCGDYTCCTTVLGQNMAYCVADYPMTNEGGTTLSTPCDAIGGGSD